MEENIYGAETEQTIAEQLSSLNQVLGGGDDGGGDSGNTEDTGDLQAQELMPTTEQPQPHDHDQPPFLRDDKDDGTDSASTYKEAEQSLQDTTGMAESSDVSGVADETAPGLDVGVVADSDANAATAAAQSQSQSQTPTAPTAATTTTTSQIPPLAIPKNRKESLEMQLKSDPRDADGWLELIAHLDSLGRNLVGDELEAWWSEYTSVYDAFFKIWPCAVKQWQAYIDKCLSLTPPRMKKVEEIFSKALKQTPSPDFWSSYLNYIRRNNDGGEGRQVVVKAYEFAISHVGQDKDSGEIWLAYIRFLKDGAATNTWEEQQRMDALRRTYQRAVVIPIQNLEAIWREWDAFEGSLNKVTAKKFLADKSPAYMTARSALREMRSLVDAPVNLFHMDGTLARRPSWTERERQVVGAWKRYLAWEEGNPLELEDEAARHSRVSYAFKKALVYMRFYPEIWYRAYIAHRSMGRDEEAFSLLKQGSEAVPESYLLSFARAEAEELAQNYREAHAVLHRLLACVVAHAQAIETGILRQQAELDAQLPSIEQQANAAQAAGENEGEVREKRRIAEGEITSKKEAVAKSKAKDLDELCKGAGLTWVMKMRLARRSEGIKAARVVFKEARTSPYCTWQVFEAGATMEYHSSKDASVATKIFELGLKRFAGEIDYVLKYLDFLISINDEGNARALFERIAPGMGAEKARPLWTRWASYEYMYSDLPSALKLEQRLADTFPEEQPIRRFAERHSHQRVDKIATTDLGYGVKAPTAPRIGDNASGGGKRERERERTQPVDLEEERNKRLKRDVGGEREGGRNSITSNNSSNNSNNNSNNNVNSKSRQSQQLPLPPHRNQRNSPAQGVQIGGAPIHLGSGRGVGGMGGIGGIAPPTAPRQVKDPLGLVLQMLPQARYFDGPIINTEDILFAFRNLQLP
ncbi:hypothetical protein E3P98_02868 [Wallemia ichthyophaga]|nr:hypothetical protein E3P98_02868 [Wallemia ichthyophaga]